eukprot:gene3394-4210_t
MASLELFDDGGVIIRVLSNVLTRLIDVNHKVNFSLYVSVDSFAKYHLELKNYLCVPESSPLSLSLSPASNVTSQLQSTPEHSSPCPQQQQQQQRQQSFSLPNPPEQRMLQLQYIQDHRQGYSGVFVQTCPEYRVRSPPHISPAHVVPPDACNANLAAQNCISLLYPMQQQPFASHPLHTASSSSLSTFSTTSTSSTSLSSRHHSNDKYDECLAYNPYGNATHHAGGHVHNPS